MVTPRKHRHADMIRQWLDDGSLEVERQTGRGDWHEENTCYWHEDRQYRFKPKMIRCGALEFPEPMRVAPADNTMYWVTCPSGYMSVANVVVWDSSYFDKHMLRIGMAHTTRAAAEAHAHALIALTEVKE